MSAEDMEGFFDVRTELWHVDVSRTSGSPLSSRPCMKTDFDEHFYKMEPSSKARLELMMPAMICLDDPNEVILHGDWDSSHMTWLELAIIRCSETNLATGEVIEGKTCKTKDEIDAMIERLLLIYVYNTQIYEPDKYGQATVHK